MKEDMDYIKKIRKETEKRQKQAAKSDVSV